ncbi:MAG: endolytic transglycosylase MltG [Solirubrobacterales bacterium]
MKKKHVILIIIVLLFAIVTVAFIVNRNKKNIINHPFTVSEVKVKITVKSGDTLDTVFDHLNNETLLKSKTVVDSFINKNGLSKTVVPGEYNISSSVSLDKLIHYLNKGILDDTPVKVTIPEGYDIESIAKLLESKGIISKSEFLKSCKEYKLPDYVKEDSKRKYSLEGYLFPDTYEFYKGTSGKAIIDEMTTRFISIVNEIKSKTGKSISNEELDKYITMASIIEKEVKLNDERGKAASVFYNRLSKGMKLESCATVLYAMGVHKDKLSYNDLKVNSPYNTYIVSGLPEGPISCPGRSCIEAAISPPSTNYLYFVSKNDGSHYFTDNYKDFLSVKQVTQGN